MKELASEEFFLQKKSNGQYSRLSRSAGLDYVMKEDFRNLIFDLTFAINAPSKQVLIANMAYHQEILAIKGGTGEGDTIDGSGNGGDSLLMLPNRKNKDQAAAPKANNIHFGASKLLTTDKNTSANNNYNNASEKGSLLYRNIYMVRCSFEGADETEQTSLISFYLKKEEISVEVFLY